MPLNSKFISEEVAREAAEIFIPALAAVVASGAMKRKALAITVGFRYQDSYAHWASRVLLRRRIELEPCDMQKYVDIADAKFETACITGRSGHELVNYPHLVQACHTHWGGSIVDDPWVVATSGCTEIEDRMCSEIVVSAIQCVMRKKMKDVRATNETIVMDALKKMEDSK